MCESGQSKTNQRRNEYIHIKMIQFMKYHMLLTDVEVAIMRQRLHNVFGNEFLIGSEDA